ncbi:MAG TPA: hypothetical protein DCY56_04910 [Candidatus Omnitrophica bacterium]|nr:hypothetical protein [Candidatus Omnitrophota bacterium]
MIKNENIICISSIDWDFVWQGHQEIMATFARNGNRVLFIENTGVRFPRIRDISRLKNRIKNWFKGVKGIRKEMENLYVYSPVVLPFPYSRIVRWVNKYLMLRIIEKWMKIMEFNAPIVWTFLPTGLALDLLNNLSKKLVVYYCIADFEKLVSNPNKIKKTERDVIKKSDLIFVQGELLKRRCEKYNSKVLVFPFGVNIDVFNKENSSLSVPSDISHIEGALIGYIGGIHKHVDFQLIKFIADKNPQWTLVFIGPIQRDISELENLKNIVFLNFKEHKELAKYITRFDACLIPYLLNEYTETVYPTKLNEYLSMAKPVVSTALPEIEAFNKKHDRIIYVGKDKETFEVCIKEALHENNPYLQKKRVEAAKENSWKMRIENMSSLIEIEIERKRLDIEVKWRENLISFYRIARRKILRFSAICVITYLLLLKTYFIWFLASPLKIFEKPQKADAIVVFGGGVGETGSPGKSTIERARYAVELYKQGYSNKILFSSGYVYVYNDADNMKLFAISMGILEKDIILEEKANSSYENVIFSKKILDKNKWRSILLVSSPYNMRRAELVFNKWAKDIKVTYTPVDKTQFYDRTSGVKLEQIKAILHEYLGIVYYFIRGYI